jgi:hypothetical protein
MPKKQIEMPDYEDHYLTIEKCDANYSFGLNRVMDFSIEINGEASPLSETSELVIKGLIITKGYNYNPKYDLIITGKDYLNRPEKKKLAPDDPEFGKLPDGIGLMEASKEDPTQVLMPIPKESMPFLAHIILNGKAKWIRLYTTRMKYRKAEVIDFSLSTAAPGNEDE